MGWRYMEVAGVVTRGPCKLKSLIVTAQAGGGYCKVRNGESEQDPVVYQAIVSSNDSRQFTFPDGLDLDRGLYIGDFNTLIGILVLWEPAAPVTGQ